jgi:uncharacterized membrane protein YidH (DUF202 family)
MARTGMSNGTVRHATAHAVAEGERWLDRLGRLGFAAKGAVYLIIGAIAVRAAIGAGGETTGPQGALQEIAERPLGETLLWVVALGLVGYAIWRFMQAARDTEHKGADAKGLVVRTGYVVSGIIHASLALAAVRIAGGSGERDGGEQGMTAQLMQQPFGRWLVVLVGLIVLGVGINQFRRAYSARFRKDLRTGEMDPEEERWAVRAGRIGYAARGVTFAIIAAFLVIAGLQADPSEAKGLGDALQTLEAQPFGPWLLAIVGVGLACYGIFQFVLARYRRMVLR